MGDFLPDLVRVVALVVGSATIAVALVVARTYWQVWRRFRAETPKGKWRGLLPRHVTLVAVSYIGLLAYTMYGLMRLLHDQLTWRGPVLLLIYALGFWAMWDVLGAQRHRSLSERTIEELGQGKGRRKRG